ncbi:PQQ-binding-like beta-propeller repeat protein [Streptomyces sp. NRRL S-37]|uniref:outer membrane protein assembly factor BamB family protein n=1 Tax=Streptomyces sp. NRRL S-37 TaxID=1463903 RepID=UPI00099D4AB2|nr:PQQ-binding-like beta-propeller repeat protein [Streptomyces sp. NRRL S-37]
MTQPPPPPNQPPQQPGFGPPQPPAAPGGPDLNKAPEPGYGYPQAPPAAPQTPAGPPAAPQEPGYGYPQAPQTPAAPPAAPQGPGYGYPQQPPAAAGYGYPGQPQQPAAYGQPGPYGQPGYGYPQPPTMPMQPQPGGGGKKFNAQAAIIVSAVAAIALIVGAGVWYASSSGKDDDKKTSAESGDGKNKTNGGGGEGGGGSSEAKEKAPADTGSKVLFQVPAPKTPKDVTTISTSGSWLTDTVYAKSGIAEIVGYDRAKGTEKWKIDLPGPVCEATHRVTEDNKTAITFKPAMPTKGNPQACTQVAVIDLEAGKELWTKTAKSGTTPVSFNNVTIGGGTVAAGSTSGGAAWDIASGEQLWAPKTSDSCYDSGYGGGEKLVAVRKCGSYDQRRLHIQNIDPKSGKVIAEYKMDEGIEYAAVVSTDPLVVAADVNESAGDGSGISDFFSIDNKTGKLRTRISAPGEEFGARCDGIYKLEKCSGLVVGDDRLYIATEEHEVGGESYSQTNEIVVFDLATGKQTGQRADAGDDYTIVPLRMDGGNLLAYKRPPYDKGGQIVSIDGGTFKQTTLMENPATETVRDVEARMSPEYSEILFSQGGLYMSDIYASDFSSASDEKEYLVIAFGTS